VIILAAFLVYTYFETDILVRLGVNPGAVPVAGMAALLLTGYFLSRKMHGWAFGMTCISIATSLITLFIILFPRVMISSTNPEWSLTIYTAASSEYTLGAMTIVALVFIPIVLLYQGWSYWVFRQRVEAKPDKLTY
jgi:cytochrome d ubiquinol oxidase subunit II